MDDITDSMDMSLSRLQELMMYRDTGVGCHSLLQEIFLTQGSNSGLLLAGRFFTVFFKEKFTVFFKEKLFSSNPFSLKNHFKV